MPADATIGPHHCLLTVPGEVKDGVSVFVIQVIEEDASTASAFIVAVLDHKVVITPLLELGPVFWIMLITYSLHRTVLCQFIISTTATETGSKHSIWAGNIPGAPSTFQG